MRKLTCLIVAVAFLTGPSAAVAGGGSSDSSVSLTLSTLNLAKPLLSDDQVKYSPEVEVMGEVNLGGNFGAAAILNFGRASIVELADPLDLTIAKFGAQGVWYPVGNFDKGMQLGLQAMRQQAFGSQDGGGASIQATANATSIAALVGYKIIATPKFTFVGQLGAGPRFIHAYATDGNASAETSELAPKIIVNLNAGWSL